MRKRTVTLVDPQRKLRKLEKIARQTSKRELVKINKEITYLKTITG